MRRSNISPEVEATILRLAAEGYSPRQIASLTGVPRTTVQRRIDAAAEAELQAVLETGTGDQDDDDDYEATLARLNAMDTGTEAEPNDLSRYRDREELRSAGRWAEAAELDRAEAEQEGDARPAL